AERLRDVGAKTAIRATLNVGAVDLTGCSANRLPEHERAMAKRLMRAYLAMGCEPTWTCSPYQAGHRPALGADVAWGESNAVVFCNSVLGARTNRYGDYLDIACAISGRAPRTGLHLAGNRRAEFVFDVSGLPAESFAEESLWPVLGSLYGRIAGSAVGVIEGIGAHPGEDALKAFGAAAASTGGVGLFHMAGITPEAPDSASILAPGAARRISVNQSDLEAQQARLATVAGADRIDAVAIGSPHLSMEECRRLERLLAGRKLAVPFYACTGRHVLKELETSGLRSSLEDAGVTIVADTCVVVTPILAEVSGGVLMTNSGKFAQYAPGNTGYGVLFGSMAQCVESAVTGRPVTRGIHG
ncbi:MAG: aconitase X catalytic domain-containing protein, partial [Nitratireductor sp.]|nr:aconitase X catalytic domain-containing protein [Nitratireductor sp.]